jgi:hypothetical protein
MMRDNQDIKDQIKKMRDLVNSNNSIVKEHIQEIKKTYLFEQSERPEVDTIATKYNVPTAVEDDIQDDEEKKNEIEQGYRISGGILTIHGKDRKDVELTTDDKKAFQETMDEFVTEVSDLVNFNQLNVYQNNVDWSGKIVDFDIDFYFTIGENNGLYISGDMVKVDENFTDAISKLKTYYEKFKSKWAKIIASRKKTKPDTNEQ